MNERIRQLAEQALFESEFDDEQNIKITMDIFAELIVRECISELEKIKRSGVPTPIQGGLNLGVVSLKEHFGVE